MALMDVIVIAALALLGGATLSWFVARGRTASQVEAAVSNACTASQVETATLTERLRAISAEVVDAKRRYDALDAVANKWRNELDLATNETARLQERATRVPILEEEVRALRVELENADADLKDSEEENATLKERSARVPDLEAELKAARSSLVEVKQQLADLRDVTSSQNSRLKAELESQTEAASRLTSERDEARERLQSSKAEATALNEQFIELQTRTDQEREGFKEQLQLLQDARTSLSDQFKNLANEILEEKSKRFTEQNQVNIGTLLEPLRTKLSEFQGKVEEVYFQEGKDRSALQEQVKHLLSLNQTLSEDAKNLTLALKGSAKTQGNWGELILERVLESSGLRKGVEYVVQDSQVREDGSRAMPDVVIHLPEDRKIIVDAKVSLIAYERYVSAATDEERAIALKGHLDSVRSHIKGLSEKRYQELYGIKSLDFVLAFIPIEPAFMMAVTNDNNLFNEAWERNVLLVSPSTLLFVVRTVAHLWRQEAQSRNAQDIAKRGAELYDRLCGFVSDLQLVGNRLDQAKRAYDDAESKLSKGRGNVIRQAEMLIELGIKPNKKLPTALVDASIESESQIDGRIADLLPGPESVSSTFVDQQSGSNWDGNPVGS